MDKRLRNYLDNLEINFKEHFHGPVFTAEDSSKSRKLSRIPGLHCKTLFLKDNLGNFYLLGMPAKKRLDIKKLEKHLKVKKIKFASAEELKEETGLVPGSVSVFGIINNKLNNVQLILDEEAWNSEIVGFHPNKNTSTLEIKHKDLEKFYNSQKCEKEIIRL